MHNDVSMEHWFTVKLPATIHNFPALVDNPREQLWGSPNWRMWIQTDNQQLAEIFAGRSRLQFADLRPVCIRIARRLHDLSRDGWMPRVDAADLIEWDRREYNTDADHAANVVLDGAGDWSYRDDEATKEAIANGANLRLCSDGARRGDGHSAAGMSLYAYFDNNRERTLLWRAGTQLATLQSAFVAELLAMEWCLDNVLKILHEKLNIKRRRV